MKDFERDKELVLLRTALESCASNLGTIAGWATFFGFIFVLKIIAAILQLIGGSK